MRLIPGMFGSEFNPVEGTPFGLRCGQMRTNDFIHNGGWYNAAGEKIGWGDLSPSDFLRITKELVDGETFIILSETDSYWSFVKEVSPMLLAWDNTVDPTEACPGITYVLNKAMMMLRHGKCYVLIDRYTRREPGEIFELNGIEFEAITKEAAAEMIRKDLA